MEDFDLRKYLAEGRLLKEGIHDMDILSTGHTNYGVRKDISPQEKFLRSHAAIIRTKPLLKKFEGLKYEDIIRMAEIDDLTTKEMSDVEYIEDRIYTHLEYWDDIPLNEEKDDITKSDNVIEFNGDDVDLDTLEWKVYNKDRTDPELVSASYTSGEELNPETLDAFTEMYSDDFNFWVWTHGTTN